MKSQKLQKPPQTACSGLWGIVINLDMIKTRHREPRLLECCLDIKQRFVIDKR